MIHFTKGDMFDVEADVRVNTVNCVGVMGAGVALAFKKRYPDMFLDYKKACDAGQVSPGNMYVWHSQANDWVINFPTKRHWREKSRYDDILSGLDALFNYLKKHVGVRVALPALGCGNGGLDWSRVKPMIEEKLQSLDAEIFVFEPSDSLKLGQKVFEKSHDKTMRELVDMGFQPFNFPNEIDVGENLFVQIKGNAELLANRWVAILISREIGAKEYAALISIAKQLSLASNPPTIALVYQNSGAEEIAEIFLSSGLAVILLLPFSPRVKKRVGLANDEKNRITYAILSVVGKNDVKPDQLDHFAGEVLMRGSSAILLSDPEPNFKSRSFLDAAKAQACFFVRYGSQSDEVVYRLEQRGFRPIGRRADTGEPNISPILETQSEVGGVFELGDKFESQITALVSSKQLHDLAKLVEKNSSPSSKIHVSLKFDLLTDEMRAEIIKLLN
jgi:O-acetyl-ADP-ribose deacetylase (regulator of RNase III)